MCPGSIYHRQSLARQIHGRTRKEGPHYELTNKGYGTKTHEEAIRRYGLRIEKSTEPWNNSPEKYVHRERYCRKFLFK